MNSCSGCKRNCCVKTGGDIELYGLDCLKLIDYFISVSDSSWNASYSWSLPFGKKLNVYHDNKKVFCVSNGWGFLEGLLSESCGFLASDLSCTIYDSEVKNPEFRDWLDSRNLSKSLRPIKCKGFPYFIEDYLSLEARKYNGLIEESPYELMGIYRSGCLIANDELCESERALLRREAGVNLRCDNQVFKEIIKGGFSNIFINDILEKAVSNIAVKI